MTADDRKLSPENLRESYWDSRTERYEAARKADRTRLLHTCGAIIGAVVPVALWLVGGRWRAVAYVAAGLYAVIMGGSLVSAGFRRGLQKFAGWLSATAGKGVTWLLLAPIYWAGFTIVRMMNRLGGDDPLHLRGDRLRSLWLQADAAKRKTACNQRMYCAEPLQRKGRPVLRLALLALALLAAGEVFFRIKGYHKPLLYMNDVHAGYLMQPNQHVFWENGEVVINNFGMRNREDVTREKPAGMFRVLLIGDSTLYGGDDLQQDQTYAVLLEKELQALAPAGRRVQVLNCGVNGAGPHQNAGFVQKYPHIFGADVFLACLPLIDIYRQKVDVNTGRFMIRQPRFAWETIAVRFFSDWSGKLRHRPGGHSSVENPDYPIEDLWRTGMAAYIEMAHSAAATGADAWFQIMPQEWAAKGMRANDGEIDRDFASQLKRFQDELAAAKVVSYFPTGIFKGNGPLEDKQAWHDEVHLGPRNHAVYSKYLAGQITANSGRWKAFAGAAPTPAPTSK